MCFLKSSLWLLLKFTFFKTLFTDLHKHSINFTNTKTSHFISLFNNNFEMCIFNYENNDHFLINNKGRSHTRISMILTIQWTDKNIYSRAQYGLSFARSLITTSLQRSDVPNVFPKFVYFSRTIYGPSVLPFWLIVAYCNIFGSAFCSYSHQNLFGIYGPFK